MLLLAQAATAKGRDAIDVVAVQRKAAPLVELVGRGVEEVAADPDKQPEVTVNATIAFTVPAPQRRWDEAKVGTELVLIDPDPAFLTDEVTEPAKLELPAVAGVATVETQVAAPD